MLITSQGKCAKFPKYKNPKLLEKSALAGLVSYFLILIVVHMADAYL